MTSEDDAMTDSGGVAGGFFAFTEITKTSAHHAYNEWHQLDHLPEQLPIPGISYGQRWVSTPRCAAVSRSRDRAGSPDLSAAQYLTMYLMREPLEETLQCFYDLAERLHQEDRFFPYRRALESGPLTVLGAFAAPRVKVSAAAVPYRPNRGIYAMVDDPMGAFENSQRSDLQRSAEQLLGVAGVAGVWFFGPGYNARDDTVSVPKGAGEPFEADMTICFLDEDPVCVAEELADLVASRVERRGSAPRLAGPFETVVPWAWGWFDERE
jgi:hypothetical protein